MSDHFVSVDERKGIRAGMKQMDTLDHLPALAGVPVIAQLKVDDVAEGWAGNALSGRDGSYSSGIERAIR